MNRRTVLRGGAAFLSSALPSALAPAARAQPGAFPNRPVRMVIPWPPGQGTDLLGRLVAQALAATLGQPVVPDNRPGAGGMTGTQHVAKSAPDGYTLLAVGGGPINISPLLRRTAYDPERELAPIAMLCNAAFVLVTRPGFPANDLADFIAAVRAAPGKHTFSSSGIASTSHLINETFARRAGLRAVHVPYNGSAASLTAVATGQVDYTLETLAGAHPLIRGGTLKAYGTSLKSGSVLAPEILPIARHPGLESFDIGGWVGVFAPAGTPEPVLSLLAAKIGEVMRGDVREKIGATGLEPDYRDTASFARHMRADREMLAEIIRLADIRVD